MVLVIDVTWVVEAHGYGPLEGGRSHVELPQHLLHFLHREPGGRCTGGRTDGAPMTPAPTPANGVHPATEDLRAAARDAYQASLAAGAPLSGAALGRQFHMSDRWGRDRVAEVQRRDARSSESGGGRQQPRDAPPVTRDETAAARDLETVPRTDPGPSRSSPATPAVETSASRGSWLDSAIILVVAVVAAAASYGHLLEVATWAGEPTLIARAFPVTVDGLALAALRRGRQGRWWLALGIVVSIAANILAQYPDLITTASPIVSAWPPVALLGTHRLLHTRR